MDWFRQGVRGFVRFVERIFAILKQYRHAGLVRHTKKNGTAVLPRGFAEYQRERRVFVSDRGVAPVH
jgi:hypothetical protein